MIEQIGAFAGLAAFLGLGVFALLSLTHGRDIRRLREWAGSAPERDAERKQSTSAIAAQRAEELRQLEQSRTAEHEAISHREERRRRRESGLPAAGRGERLRQGIGGIGERLAEPRYLIALFVIVLVVVAGVGYSLVSGGSDEDGGKADQAAKQAAAQTMKPAEIEVTVLNGTSVPGLAASYGDMVEGKGFQLGAVTNSSSSYAESVVTYKSGHKQEAKKVAKQLDISDLEPMSLEIESVAAGANVAVIVGEDNAAAAG